MKILFLVLHKYKNVFNIFRIKKFFFNSILLIAPKNCHVFRAWNGFSHQVVFESYIFCMHGAYNLERERSMTKTTLSAYSMHSYHIQFGVELTWS